MPPRKSLSYPQWVKLSNANELCFVGKDTVAVGCGCHIMFYSLDGNLENLYIANSEERGDGVATIAGHRTAPIFALAEKCVNPRILVISYPAVEGAVAILKGNIKGQYLSMVFSEMEYLVTLSGVPDFIIMVWCWRTGIQMVCKETNVINPQQQLSSSISAPAIISQLAKGENRLILWEMNVCAKLCCLTSRDVKLPECSVPVDVCFTTEGTVLYIDSLGDVFQVDLEDFIAVRRIRFTSETDSIMLDNTELTPLPVEPCMTFCKTGIMVSGPLPVIKLYKRFGDWACVWSLQLVSPLRWLTYLIEGDNVLGLTFKNELVLIDSGKHPQVSLLKYYGNNFIDMELVYPDGNTIVTVNSSDELQVWGKEDGHLMGVYDIRSTAQTCHRPDSKFISIKANPHYPYVGVAMSQGLLLLVSALHPTSPTTLAQFLLCDDEISMVCFAPAGDVFVAVTATTGQFFLIQGMPGQEMQIVAHLVLGKPVVDCILLPDERPVLAILLATEKCCHVGNSVMLYTLEPDGLHADVTTIMEHSYSRIVNTSNQNLCYGAVHRSRKIHVLEIGTKMGIKLKEEILTGHQMRHVQVSELVEYGLLTYGMDGIVIARPIRSKQQFYIVLPHHRADLGVQKAFQDPKGEFVISLGRDKSLICSKLKRTAKYTPGSTEPSPDMVEKFSEPTTGFCLEGEDVGLTWLQYKEKLRILDEERSAESEKAQLKLDFKELQQKVIAMLSENEIAEPEEQLSVAAFDLNKEIRESAIEEGRQQRERLKAHTQATISIMEQKSAIIKEKCWDPVCVKPTSIESLTGKYKVDNYALLPESYEEKQTLDMVTERRKMELKAATSDSFQPWVQATKSDAALDLLSAEGSYCLIDDAARFKQALQATEETSPQDLAGREIAESPYVMTGSSLYKYIEPSAYHISQFELNTYTQTYHSIVLLKRDVRGLQEWFNNQFQIMYQAKEREMSTVRELHQRIRHIFKELLLTCSVTHPDAEPLDPEWTQYEKPEMILNVQDEEIGVELYISPSQQELLRQQAEEEEQLRLLLLADNFRELALIKMMDGVLEIRWEDELKRDVPKPACMLDKNPEDFNEDDLRAVREYERKVEFLMNERQHYRKMLEAEYRRVKQSLKESLNKFENRLLELFNLKLCVEAASTQHTLRILRARLLNPNRMLLEQNERTVRKSISANQKTLTEEQTIVAQMQESTGECRAAYESQLTKDKGLDGKFKKEFPELSPMMVEVAFRLYRKRPKMQPRALVSATLLNELGRCAVACKKPPYLPVECLEILKAIDALDNSANAPPNMNPDSWANICRLRRQRIESEFKIKALALQIAEAENTLALFQKSVKALKEKDKELQTQLRTVHEEQLLFEHDIEVQIVLKQGLVEIPITGNVSDFDNAILINRKDVANINEVIKAAGYKKLEAMKFACNFRRGIIFREWDHKRMRMHIEDREEELKTVQSVKVIKELQEWLHKKKGVTDDKGMLSLDKELTRIRAGFEKYINALAIVVKDYELRIEAKNRGNRRVDKAITDINVQVNGLQLERDLVTEHTMKEDQKKRMEMILQRANLVRQVHTLHSEIIALESELDSLRLRTYPILENPHRVGQ